jgi:hypothetical protein
MEFVEAPPFTRHLPEYLSEDGHKDLQARAAEKGVEGCD